MDLSGNQLVLGIFYKGSQLVTRHRINLSLSPLDFLRLQDQSAVEGKTPSTFASDVLKAYMIRNRFPVSRELQGDVKTASKPLLREAGPSVPIPAQKPLDEAVKLSRKQRRELERANQKAGR